MACPGGCVGGAGQPLGAIKDMKDIRKVEVIAYIKVIAKKT